MSIKEVWRIVFLLIIVFALRGNSLAQLPELKFERIGSEDGLPQSTIHGIVKDKYGFMWFGTWGGLCRYDGYSFKIYRSNPRDKKSINNSRIHNIIKDSDGNIWVLTFQDKELCRYNYETDNFDRIPVSQVSSSFLDLLVRWKHYESITYSHKQFKWSLDKYTNSLLQVDLKTNKKKYYDSNPANRWSLSGSFAVDMYRDDHGIFWVGTFSNGINKANLNAKPFEYYYHDPQNPSIASNNVRAICEDKKGNLWIGTYDKGITVIGPGGYKHIVVDKNEKSNLTHNQIKTIFCDSKGLIWIGTRKGLVCYNPLTQSFRNFKQLDREYISVYAITEDSDNNIWIGSFWRGIYKFDRQKNKLIHFNASKILKHRNARAIIQDQKKQLWVGTEGGGISVLKLEKDSVSLVTQYFREENKSDNTISDNRINYLYEDRSGLIWIATGNGLDCFDPRQARFIQLPEKSGLNSITISGIAEDSKGYLWISHKKGLSRLNTKTFSTRNYTLADGLQSNEFTDGAVFRSPHRNRLYFGGNSGFNAFNPDSILPEKTVPRTVLTKLEILNREVDVNDTVNGRVLLTRPLYLSREIELNYEDKSVAIQFSGLHYSNPEGNKYAYKLEGFDKDWVHTDADRRIATYSNLEPGSYTFKVISSNSDGIWNHKPAMLTIKVQPPFWASSWAYVLYTLLVLAAVYAYHYYSTRFARLKSKLAYESLVREKESELHQNKLQFFTNISHEIKTPLTLILAPLERLISMFAGNKLVESQLLTMKSSGDRLLKLVNQLLDLRKLETGNGELSLQKHQVIALLGKIIEPFRPLADIKIIKLDFSYPQTDFYMYLDEDKIEKVLANLLSNALKFTPEEGIIRLSLNRVKRNSSFWVDIEVSNTGNGIPEADKEKIFRPFQQGSGRKEGGTGLGLAYSKALIELHGGQITVTDSKIGENVYETCFTVSLPERTDYPTTNQGEGNLPESAHILDFPLDYSINQSKREPVLINGKVARVLLVEDNAELRQYLKSYFKENYQVLEATNGKEGLERAIEHLPDLVISDVMMPEMDGFEFCKAIKSDSKTAHIPVILLTAKTPLEDRIEGIETGADDYITKPFSLRFLTLKVRNLLTERNRLREKYRKDVYLQPSAPELPLSADDKLLKNLLQYIDERLSDPELNVDEICQKVGVGRTQLYRKIKTLTGLSIAEMIREMRLKRAQQLLKEKKFNVNEIAYALGFSDPDYFRRCFKAEFGISPSEYQKGIELGNETWL